MKTKIIMALALLATTGGMKVQAQQKSRQDKNYVLFHEQDTDADKIRKAAQVAPSPRQLSWQQMELTGFLHFGVNTFTNKEWGDGSESPAIFNPTALDARQWVRVSKEAGIKLVILTAKHHDGFCLWPSAYTEHSVKNSPWKNGQGDVVKEVAAACKEYGVKFGVYLSPWDRNSAFFGDSARYNDYFINQLTELLTNYGRIDEVWFDGANGEGPTGKKQYYDYNRWYTHIRKLQPGAVIAVMGPDVRWVGTESGYGRETEWSVLPADEMIQDKIAANSQQAAGFAPMNLMEDDLGSRAKILKAKSLVWYPAETDVSIRPGWFYHPAEDNKVKTPEKLMDIYFSSVGRNGVLLLNIPPDTRGLIHEQDVKSLTGWKKLKDQTFAHNLLRKASITAKGKNAKVLVDGRTDTDWTTTGKDSTAVITFTLPVEQEFDVLLLQENIAKGQRIENFVLEVEQGGEWKKVTSGTTVGYKRLLRFAPVKAKKIRLSITQCRTQPVLAEIGLYKQP
ncbi:alpha-L-fucosidase [Terrimonas rubra]|uniref:alpha-L-fucosidase n=1 Tax=Terrimonas rubra TaxID=1035890 RepID=A0ABW5ZYX8_9BACT